MSFGTQSVGLNRSSRFRSNSAGSGGAGKGEARNTADSIDSRTAWSPLQLPTRTLVTSPPGTCVTYTTHSMPGLAEGGLSQALWMRAWICPIQLDMAALERAAIAFSS